MLFMKRWKLSTKGKQAFSVAFVALTLLFIVLLFALKENIAQMASKMVKAQAGSDIQNSESAFVDSLFNYSENGLNYEITFLEFGAKGCSACKRMESVMEDVRVKYPDRVNVVFVNILLPENRRLMKYFGVVAIPSQVLLNTEGQEFFRHTGFIGTKELSVNFTLNH